MYANKVNDNCIIVYFDDMKQSDLIANGWIGDESFARIYFDEKKFIQEIRIYKKSGDNYYMPLHPAAWEWMSNMKNERLIDVAKKVDRQIRL